MNNKDVLKIADVSDTPATRRKVPRVNLQTPEPFPENAPTGEDLRALVGIETTDAAIGIIASGLESLSGKSSIYRQFFLALFAEETPSTALEAMLLVQMFSVHIQTIKLGSYADASTSSDARAALSKAMNNSARTFTDQMMALKKYRSKVSQTVRIERVNINEGGQAIVGNVGTQGGYDEN